MRGGFARTIGRAAALAVLAGALAGCMSGSNPLRAVGAPAVSPRQQLEETAAKAALDKNKLEQGIPLNIGEDTGKAPATPAAIPAAPQMAATREGSVEQIRAKAATSGGVPTNVFAERDGATTGMSKADQEKARAELEAAAARNQALLSGTDARSKAAAAKKLKQQAQSHYEDALKEIEN
ncbi:MAG: hypothetical protein MUE79_02195 [Nitratireductor sp.]|nr:hypothetical protein [Nitratireductor sp.]